MGEGKRVRKRLAGLQTAIDTHLQKIADELSKLKPDYSMIAHWEGEIRGWRKEVERLQKRLATRRKRG